MVAEARGHVGEPLAGVDAVGALVDDDDLVEQGQHVVLGGERPQGGDAVVGAVVGAHDDRGAAVGAGGRDGPAGVVEHQFVVVGDDLDPQPAAVEETVERRREAHVLGGGVVHGERARDPVGVGGAQHQAAGAAGASLEPHLGGRRPALPVARREAPVVGVGAHVAVLAHAEVPAAPLGAPAQDLDVELVRNLRGGAGEQPAAHHQASSLTRRFGVARGRERGGVGHAGGLPGGRAVRRGTGVPPPG